MGNNILKNSKVLVTIFIIIVVSSNLISCSKKDKENVLLDDVKNQSKIEDQEIRTAIDNGNKYLEEGNYEKAKKWYDKAISISKNNIDTYIKIKDKYLEKDRKDDAYSIVRLAIDNKVDVENMKKELKRIEDTFDPIVINKSIYIGENYKLPSETILNINNSKVTGKISWGNNKVSTNKSGKFTYKGNISQYGRKVIVNLEVKDKKYNTNVKDSIDDKLLNKNIVEDNTTNQSDSNIVEKKSMITLEEAESIMESKYEKEKYSWGTDGEVLTDDKGEYYLYQVVDIELRSQGYTGTSWVKVYEDGTIYED